MNTNNTIETIRSFNRFYLAKMGFMNQHYLEAGYSIAEVRILFELTTTPNCIQQDLALALDIDKSYLSRLIQRLLRKELIDKQKSSDDKRAYNLFLTEKGQVEVNRLIQLSNQQILMKTSHLSSSECNELCDAMYTIISIFSNS